MSPSTQAPGRGLSVSVDARPLDLENVRAQGIGRYAHALIGPLHDVAEERGHELVVWRRPGGRGSPFENGAHPLPDQRFLRRPTLQLLRSGVAVHHSLSLYETPLLSRPPLVVTMHDVVPLQWPGRYLRTGLVHRTLYRALRRAAAVLCVSRAARDDLLAHLDLESERVHVIPEAAGGQFRPADPAPVRARLGLDGPYLLYVGSLVESDPRKDVEGLVDAFADWSKSEQRPETLVLAGASGQAARDLERRAEAAGARVKLAGFVPDAELPALYSGASCWVSASRYEGFGLPALESLACGTPVAAYEVGALPETAGPGALFAPAGDPAELMRAAGRLCDEAELRARLSAAGLGHAGRFSWRRTAELTFDLYEALA